MDSISPDIAKLLNQAGIILNFSSFFLAAPEIVGTERLKVWVSHATGGIVAYVVGAFFAGIIFFVDTVILLSLYWSRNPITETISTQVVVSVFYIIPLIVFLVVFSQVQDRLTSAIVKFFASDDSRRRWIFRSGVTMFVLGNAIQFIATL